MDLDFLPFTDIYTENITNHVDDTFNVTAFECILVTLSRTSTTGKQHVVS